MPPPALAHKAGSHVFIMISNQYFDETPGLFSSESCRKGILTRSAAPSSAFQGGAKSAALGQP